MNGCFNPWVYSVCPYGGGLTVGISYEHHKVLDWLFKDKTFRMCEAFRNALCIVNNPSSQAIFATLLSEFLHQQCHCCGYSLLHLSVSFGSRDLVQFYLQRNVNVNAKNDHGDTALHMAVVQGDHWIVQQLLSHGADLNAKDDIGSTPLEICLGNWGSSALVVHSLLQRGARVNNLFSRATRVFSFFAMLEANVGMPLYEAVYSNDEKKTRRLLEDGACPEQRYYNCTALQVACMQNFVDCVAVLLEAGADVDREDSEGRTALHHAVMGARAEVVRLLLAHGCAYQVEDKFGNSALDLAVLGNKVEIMDILLDHGAHYTPNVPFEAVELGCNEALARLVQRGCVNGSEISEQHGTLVDHARRKGREEFAVLLMGNQRNNRPRARCRV